MPEDLAVASRSAAQLKAQGFVRLAAAELAVLSGVPAAGWRSCEPAWSDLPADAYLRDNGRYRFRRHSCFVQELAAGSLAQTPPRAHWQPTTYNALHGGLHRWYEPIAPALTGSANWRALLLGLGGTFAVVRPTPRWHIEAHQFRIDTASGIGRPTPEGAHRDGVDFVAVILVARHAVRGGETRVFATDSDVAARFTMTEPWSALLLDDRRVIHETTPIQPADVAGWRDTLVLTYRAAGFQEPAEDGITGSRRQAGE